MLNDFEKERDNCRHKNEFGIIFGDFIDDKVGFQPRIDQIRNLQ